TMMEKWKGDDAEKKSYVDSDGKNGKELMLGVDSDGKRERINATLLRRWYLTKNNKNTSMPAKGDIRISHHEPNDIVQIPSQAKQQKLAKEDVGISNQQNDVAEEKRQKNYPPLSSALHLKGK
ncbi:hypothetical protein HAX54_007969, partial [Datura stramonium]|nr:hypothetical protein [Datura stramonium]